MVEYHKWVGITFDEVKSQLGADPAFSTSSEVVTAAADVWNRRKSELQSATVTQARRIASEEIEVR